MITEILRAGYPSAINHAIDVLHHGGLVAFPTDTVYGLAAIPFKREDVEGLFSAKGRNNTRAIAILIADYADLNLVVDHFDEIPRPTCTPFLARTINHHRTKTRQLT